jgi:hypothetical protein
LEAVFTCVNDLIASEQVYCTSRPVTGMFSEIYLVAVDGIVDSITYTMHRNSMTTGNLIWLWDKPDTIAFSHHFVNLYWVDQHVTAQVSTHGGKFNYFSPVLWVIFD